MDLLQGGTTRSSTHGVILIENDSKTDYDRSMRKSVGLGTKESRSTIR
jgi:hypothetical protein